MNQAGVLFVLKIRLYKKKAFWKVHPLASECDNNTSSDIVCTTYNYPTLQQNSPYIMPANMRFVVKGGNLSCYLACVATSFTIIH